MHDSKFEKVKQIILDYILPSLAEVFGDEQSMVNVE